MLDFGKICRVCMRSEQDLVLIFDEKCTGASTGIAKMFDECCKYKVVRNDALPHHICSNCLTSLKNAHCFKQECEKSYRHMIQILTNSIKTEDTENSLSAEYCTHSEKGTQTDASALHPCERCDRKFISIDELLLHRTTDHKGSAIVCRYCSKKFDRIGYLRSHIAFAHPESGCISHSQCYICQRQFSRTDHMRRHLRDVHKITNPRKESGSASNREINETDKEEEESAATAIAKEQDADEKSLLKPMEKVQTIMADEHDTEQQSLVKPIEPMHTVLINENFEGDYIKLENFEEEDTFGGTLDESICDEDAPYILTQESHSSSSSCSTKSNVKKCKTLISKEFFCEDCKKTYANEKQYKRHQNTTHKEKKHSCNVCGKTFYRKIDLKEHLRVHNEKRFTCRECAQNFIKKEELDAHRKSEGHDKPMLCPECGLRCKSSSSLMAHMRRHTGEKPFKCKFCNKGFPRSDDLKQHEKYHTNEKSHFCETCGKGFQRKYHLTVHLRVHTGEKPHKCPHCPQAFSQGHDLKLHIRRHTGERLRCEFCDATFLQGYKIRQHKLTVHGIKEDPPTQRLEKFTSLEQQEKQIKEIQKRQTS